MFVEYARPDTAKANIFGTNGQRLHIRHESGESAEPCVGGALLAIRRVHTLAGVQRGLDIVMKD